MSPEPTSTDWPAHVDTSTPVKPGSCVASGKPVGRIVIDYADRYITISDEIINGSHKSWAWHRGCEVAEGLVRISGDNIIVTYRLTGEQDYAGNWYAVKIREEEVSGDR